MRPHTWYSALVDVEIVRSANRALAPYNNASPTSGEIRLMRPHARDHRSAQGVAQVRDGYGGIVQHGLAKASHTGGRREGTPGRS